MIKIKLLRKRNLTFLLLLAAGLWGGSIAYAQQTECAEVKIVIEQKLSFERQAFDAKMIISNGLSTLDIKNVEIDLQFLDQDGQIINATLDPNDINSKFFYKIDSLEGIQSIEGEGDIPAKSTAEIHWLIIPSKNAVLSEDSLYYVGATVNYQLNDAPTTVEVTPDYIVVRPLPELSIDYFLPKEVYGDDPLTTAVEPATPFTLGVRVKNVGFGPAFNASIESAQPRIINNDKNLLVNYEILGSYVNDKIINKSFHIDLENIMPDESKVGRWLMTSSLSGEFTDFNATYTHSDNLGGSLTSLIKDIKTHTLIKDVKVNPMGFPGRDDIRDFLALDEDGLRLYESQGIDTKVTDLSAKSRIELNNGQVKLFLSPLPDGFVYLKIEDPYQGRKDLVNVTTSLPSPENVFPDNFWLSKERNVDNTWTHYVNLFEMFGGFSSYDLIYADAKLSQVSGIVFNDQNNNGLKEAGDVGLEGVKVTLTGIDNKGLNINEIAYTLRDGSYQFNQLNPGTYSIAVDSVNGLLDGRSFSGRAGGTAGTAVIRDINLLASSHADDNTFAKLDATSKDLIPGEADLSIFMLTPTLSKQPVIGKVFSIYLTVVNKGPDIAEDSVVELKLPANLEFVDIQKGYEFDDGKIKVGDVKVMPEGSNVKPIPIRVNFKALTDDPISLFARIGSRTNTEGSKYNTSSITILPAPLTK